MAKRKSSSGRRRPSKRGVTLGRERFAKISAVEGIEFSAGMRARAAEFDHLGMTPAKRRRAIIEAYSKR
jgi:hypothetical protein